MIPSGEHPLYEFGGTGSVLHLAVANGFPPQTYAPLVQPLTEHYRVISLPPRALWTPPQPPERVRSWKDLAQDLRAGMAKHDLRGAIGLGHSFGAIVSMVAAADQPGLFRGLILLDPTIFMPRVLLTLRLMQLTGQQRRMPLVSVAERRRARFSSVEDAYTYWRGKRLFADWTDEALRRYAEAMTRPAADGDGVELAWPPAWEARYYQTILTTTWRYLPMLRDLPMLMVRGGTTDTFLPDAAARLRRALPKADYAVIEGHGHLFPQTAPDATREVIQAWLAGKAF